VCEAANDNGCASKRMQKYRYQSAPTSDRVFLKTNIDHHWLQRYLAGYCREKKRDKVHLHIQFAGTCHALFISNPKNLRHPIITDQTLTPYFFGAFLIPPALLVVADLRQDS
jgi:hypothetical protein